MLWEQVHFFVGEGPLFAWEKVHFSCGKREGPLFGGKRPPKISVLSAQQASGADLHGMCDQVKVLPAQYVKRQADLHGV